jgi:hypothetical protein
MFSSGDRGNDSRMVVIKRLLYHDHADVVINGPDYNYERFAPRNGDGRATQAHGRRRFIGAT